MKSNILIRPIITEKSMKDAASGRFTFAVDKEANKAQIALAISQTFPVKVTAVKTITIKGKTRRSGKARRAVLLSSWKKALIQLEKGQKIDLFDVTENAKKT